jgi:hypothetical protein
MKSALKISKIRGENLDFDRATSAGGFSDSKSYAG